MLSHIQNDTPQNPAALRNSENAEAVGEVHPLLLLALQQSGVVVQGILQASCADKDMIKTIQALGGGEITLYWHNGVLTGVFRLALGVTFQDGCVVIYMGNGEVPASLAGSSLDQVIRTPGCDFSIFQITQVDAPMGGRQHLHISAKPVPFDSDGNLLR